jgi:Family of unknown function (DUF6082)
MVVATISVLISSIALAGVALSLLLQAWQLRTSQLQASRAAQAELVRICIDNPELTAAALGKTDPDGYVKSVFVNWNIKYLELSYSIKAISASSVQVQVAGIFGAEYPRNWWSEVRPIYAAEATTRRERSFFAIVDREFNRASEDRDRAEHPGDTKSAEPIVPPPP